MTDAGRFPSVTVGVSIVLYRTLPLAGGISPVRSGAPLGSPPGVALPRPVVYITRKSPALAGCPQIASGLRLEAAQFPGIFRAAAMLSGMASHAVALNCAITLNRALLDGSLSVYRPGVTGAMLMAKFGSVPVGVLSWTLTAPVVGSSYGTRRSI